MESWWLIAHSDRGGEGAGRAVALPLFYWDLFSRGPVDMEKIPIKLLDFALKGGRLEQVVFDVACSAGVFFERAICSRKRHVETSRREDKIKDGGYNNITNTNKVSPNQNTPALQAIFDEFLKTMQFLWKSGMFACLNNYNPMCVQG